MFLLSCILVFFLSFPNSFASSIRPRPLKRIAHPETLSIEILPRSHIDNYDTFNRRSRSLDSLDLLHSDSFRLTLSAFGETFYLHLQPNEHLIHPAARINYFSTNPDGQAVLTRTEPLLRESVKAYYGDVVPAHLSLEKLRLDAARVVPDTTHRLGWARIMVHYQGDPNTGAPPVVEGAFTVGGVTHHILTSDNYLRNKQRLDPEIVDLTHSAAGLVIWRDSDVLPNHEEEALRLKHGLPPKVSALERPTSCAHDSLTYNTDPYENPALRIPQASSSWYDPFNVLDTSPIFPNVSAFKRDDVAGDGMNTTNFVNNIGDGSGCPSSPKVVYMGVAADCTYTRLYGSQSNATQQILNDWNSASALYKNTFKISLGIVELQIMDSNCPSSTDPTVPWNIDCGSVTLSDRLSLFSQWRGGKGVDGSGLWHLLSTCTTGSEVGIAWLATLCQVTATGNSPNVVSGTGVSTAGRTEWQVISHEIGHNFGAIHDCTDGCSMSSACCPFSTTTCSASSKFIMNPTTSESEAQFSPCSLGNICSLMMGVGGGQTNTSCVLDPDPTRQVISMQMCGNGIVEAGEECDPGLGSNSTCCDPQTCKFTAGAVCDPTSSTCCTSDCQLAPATQLCRQSRDARCDVAEFCTGTSSTCPTDTTKPNGQSCGSGGLACADGICTSLDLQCQSAGSTLGLTKACPAKNDKSCQVSCQDPGTANQCIVLQTQLANGSPCGYGGTCLNGSCHSGSIWDTFKAWYTENLQISVPVTVVVGLFVLIATAYCFKAVFRRVNGSRSRRLSTEPALARIRAQRISSWPTENSAPSSVSQGRGALPRQPRQVGPGMAGIGANGLVREENPFMFNGPPISHPPALQPRHHRDWVDASVYNGHGYQPHY
ncbi:Metallo-peptidase family M12-domain-containing protein [Thelephora terrestris]|uniref:Disintegrin and metalloproteinase domain-containing protein B n=1 Tax=Thelephora terrestris TaxID=56493 RepID=A0A9P6HI41_9AGAM|nr:Metallo-peptidase family M12-domain-containing protein [Thelephora terrestris]